LNKVLNLTYDKKAYILNQGEYSIIHKVEGKLLFCINVLMEKTQNFMAS